MSTLQGDPPSGLEPKHFRVPIGNVNARVIINAINRAFAHSGFDFQGSVLSRLAVPPGAPSAGDRHLIIAVAAGVWSTHEDDITEWNGAQQKWEFFIPTAGTIVYVEDEGDFYVFNGVNWLLFPILGAVPDTRVLTAGAGLVGGGDLSADRTFDAVANADGSLVVNADDMQVGVLATDAQHGVRGGGTQHASVVAAGAAGFMTGADKTKLNGVATGAQVNVVDSVFGRVGAVVAAAADYAFSQISGTISDAQHDVRAGGTLHALVIAAGAAGFMSGVDKTKLDGLSAMIFMGGASMGGGDTGKHFASQSNSNGGKNAALSQDNQMASGIGGTLRRLTWSTATADATTILKILVAGLVVETITLTGVSGSSALTAAVALGDLVAVEYDAGTSPGKTTVQVYAA